MWSWPAFAVVAYLEFNPVLLDPNLHGDVLRAGLNGVRYELAGDEDDIVLELGSQSLGSECQLVAHELPGNRGCRQVACELNLHD